MSAYRHRVRLVRDVTVKSTPLGLEEFTPAPGNVGGVRYTAGVRGTLLDREPSVLGFFFVSVDGASTVMLRRESFEVVL